MLRFEGVAKVNDTIKAFDFPPFRGDEACYIVGTVIDKGDITGRGYHAYAVRVEHDVWDGKSADSRKHSRVGTVVYVPFETSMDYDNRVVKV